MIKMTEPLYRGITEVGDEGRDLTEGYSTKVEIEDLMETIHSYDVTADPANDRYILQDHEHQYSLNIQRIDPDTGYAFAYAEEEERFANKDLEKIDVLHPEDFEEIRPTDGALFGNGSEALYQASTRAEKFEVKEV